MSAVVIAGDTSGTITLNAPAVSGTTTLTLPATTGTVLTSVSPASDLPSSIKGPAFSAYSTVNQSTSTATTTKVQLNTERFDTNNNFDNTTNYRFTPTIAGYYQISGAVTYTSAANNYGAAAIINKNGSDYAWGTATGTNQMYATAQVSSLIYLNGSTDYIELYVYNGSGASQTTGGFSFYTYMTGFLARSA